MPQPLAIHVFDNLMLGMTVHNGLTKLGYEVQRLDNASLLTQKVAEVKPFLVAIDLTTKMGDANAAIRAIKTDASLQHVRVIAYGDHQNEPLLDAARQAGADVVTSNSAVASHLEEVVQQALA
jgi:DNA-binding NarL/FixJ family response regulator